MARESNARSLKEAEQMKIIMFYEAFNRKSGSKTVTHHGRVRIVKGYVIP